MRKSKRFLLGLACAALFAPASLNAADCNYGTITRSDGARGLTSFTLTDGTASAKVEVNQGTSYGSPVFLDKTDQDPLQVTPGSEIFFSEIMWKGEWMHGYLYIDYDGDGDYDTIVNPNGDPNGELVSYSFYSANNTSNGTNSKGEPVANNTGVSTYTMPSFKLPANINPGEYNALFKIDWNSLDPCGNPSSSNKIGANGGAAVKFKIEVIYVVERTINISSSDPKKGSVSFRDFPGVQSVKVAGPVTIVATPAENHDFVNWTVAGTPLSTDAEYTVNGNDDMTIVGNFVSYEEAGIVPATRGDNIIQLSELNGLSKVTCFADQGIAVRANRSAADNPIRIMGKQYQSGVGTHAPSVAYIELNGATSFHAVLGVDDEVLPNKDKPNECIVDYIVTLYGDSMDDAHEQCRGTLSMKNSDYSYTLDLKNLSGYQYLKLEFAQGEQAWSDHADWADARFEYEGVAPRFVTTSEMFGGTPIYETLLASATTLYSLPGVRFMHKLRSESEDAKISVKNLPAGLTFNEKRNLVEGIIDREGTYHYTVVVSVASGVNETPVTLTVSSDLQQPTPFMGWLSWNVIEGNISNAVVKTVADAMVSSGLLDAGYNYLVIDDLWHASSRNADKTPREDPNKFPEGMKAAADYAHSKGLKFGIYSDAAEYTCAKAYGSLGYEEIDAKQYADWGVDLLKYDYCSAPTDVETAKARYQDMSNALKKSGRDILLYICEWGVRQPWKWGAEVGGTCWRSTYDTRDCWNGQESSNGIGILQSIKNMKNLWAYNGVNRWNDADMMCVGIHGKGKSSSDLCASPAGMTQDEYRTQFSLWCMWSSPLTLSFDLRNPIDEDDLAIMTNKDLIDLDQDPMGQAAELVYEEPNSLIVFAKDLANGDVAVSVTNLSSVAKSYTINFKDIPGLDASKSYYVRDLVKRENFDGVVKGSIECASIPTHATVVYRLSEDEASEPVKLEWVSTSLTATEITHNSADVEIKYNVENLPEGHTIGAEAVLKGGGSSVKFPLEVKANPNTQTLKFTDLASKTKHEYDVYLREYSNNAVVGGATGTVKSLPLAFETLDDTSSVVEDVIADMAETGARYFNLMGEEVTNPGAGVYIRVQGEKVTKVHVIM